MKEFLSHLEFVLQPEVDKVINHEFLRRLGDGKLNKNQIIKFALDYNFYCQCFPQLLGYAAGKIKDDKTRMPIIENLWEEHGEGDLQKSHRQLFINFLKSLGISDYEIAKSKPTEATKKYIDELLSICENGDALEVLALLGPGTEYFSSKEFDVIFKSLQKYPFGGNLDLDFWSVHIDLDDHHYHDMLKSIEPLLITDLDERRVEEISLKTIELELFYWDEMNKYII